LDLPGISSDSDVAENTNEEEDDDPFDLSLPSRKNRYADTYMDLTQEGEDEFEEREEKIPEELLTRLLHEFFKEDGTRISKDANKAIGRYMETFVREALARAAYMSEQGEERGMLEVEDLEKLAPQLLLDF
jgi:centromere protein X